MYQQVNSNLSAEEKLSRLIRQSAVQLSMHLTRLEFLTDKFFLPVDGYVGVERDYLISVLYTINETLAVLHFTGSKDIIDAIFLNNLEARDWYDEAIKEIHNSILENPAVLEDMELFETRLIQLNPPPSEEGVMEDELGDDAALSDAEREALGLNGSGDTALLDAAGGDPVEADSDSLQSALDSLDHSDPTHWTKAGDPDLTVLTELTGKQTSRVMVQKVAPDFKRKAA